MSQDFKEAIRKFYAMNISEAILWVVEFDLFSVHDYTMQI